MRKKDDGFYLLFILFSFFVLMISSFIYGLYYNDVIKLETDKFVRIEYTIYMATSFIVAATSSCSSFVYVYLIKKLEK